MLRVQNQVLEPATNLLGYKLEIWTVPGIVKLMPQQALLA